MDHCTFINRDAEHTSLDKCDNDTIYTDRCVFVHSKQITTSQLTIAHYREIIVTRSFFFRFIPLHSSDLSVTFAFHQPPIFSDHLPTKRRRGSSSLSPIQQIHSNGDEFRRAVIVQAMLPRNEDYFSRKLFKFRAKERRINIIDTPERDAYSLTPFSWNVERLMRRPLKKQRNISTMPYQMLAF